MSSTLCKLYAQRRLDELLHRYDQALTHGREPFRRLIQAIRAFTQILKPLPERGWSDPQITERIVRACARMATLVFQWHRLPEDWVVPATSPFVQFRSLVSHLFDRYPVPRFMVPIWLQDGLEDPDAMWYVDLYLHLAAGRSIRRFPVPVPCGLSKSAAAYFMQAPDDFHPFTAMQWGWVRSLGADKGLARLLVRQEYLAVPSERNDFWESVIRFLIMHQPISDEEVVAIVQFIDQQRFQPAEVVWGRGAGPQPLQPEFTLQGRTLMSLRRHMTNWRTEVAVTIRTLPIVIPACWTPIGIRSFLFHDGHRQWSIEELLSAKELEIEGGIMEHCVASYRSVCASRRTSIWSMKVEEGDVRKRVLTIEVAPQTKTIWQAKGKRNAPPTGEVSTVLRRWAQQEGLNFGQRS